MIKVFFGFIVWLIRTSASEIACIFIIAVSFLSIIYFPCYSAYFIPLSIVVTIFILMRNKKWY